MIEGFKSACHRIEVYCKVADKPPFHPRTVLGRYRLRHAISDAGRPVVDIDDIEGVVQLVLAKAERLETMLERVRAVAIGEP